MLTVIVTILTITGGLFAVFVAITGRFMCSVNSYCDNKLGFLCALLAVIVTIMTITGRYICSLSSYCDNNRDVYMQC